MDYESLIDRYYPAGSALRDIYLRHCRAVADEALSISHRKGLPISDADVEAAAMLHDIGIFAADAPGIECRGTEPYIMHGITGARILRENGADERFARVAERHTGAGITADDIDRQGLPLPKRDYCPETLLERLICYADKFYSKSGDMNRKPIETVRRGLGRIGADTLDRFDTLHKEFGD